MVTNRPFLHAALLITALGVCWGDERMVPGTGDVTRMLKDIFTSHDAPFAAMRHPIAGREARQTMQTFIENQLELLFVVAKQKGYEATRETVHFNTTLNHLGSHQQVDGANVLFILKGNVSRSEDEPLMLLTNYDTGVDSNEVNEGSGVAALLVLIETLLEELHQHEHKVTNSVIFAFTDVAYKKYSGNHASEGMTGAAYLAKYWLPRYLVDRKSFRGAIVLDHIMNYNDAPQSQLVTNLGLDKSFPDAYALISEGNFNGDFLGLLHRDDRLDNPLVDKLEYAWQHSLVETRGSVELQGGLSLRPRLIKFTFVQDIQNGLGMTEFLNSEQSAFWYHQSGDIKQSEYPAVTLTDTRHHRTSSGDVGCRVHCSLDRMLTKKNLAFMKRTVNTLEAAILDMQTDANGALTSMHASFFLLVPPLLVCLRNSNLA